MLKIFGFSAIFLSYVTNGSGGGVLSGAAAGYSIMRDGNAITIEDGTINGGFYAGYGSVSISGGKFSFDPSDLLKSGYVATQNGNYWEVFSQHSHNFTYSADAVPGHPHMIRRTSADCFLRRIGIRQKCSRTAEIAPPPGCRLLFVMLIRWG